MQNASAILCITGRAGLGKIVMGIVLNTTQPLLTAAMYIQVRIVCGFLIGSLVLMVQKILIS